MLPDLAVDTAATGGAVAVTVAGEVDMATCPVLDEHLRAACQRAGPSGAMVIDLRAVRFFGAAGITVLLAAQQACREQGVTLHILATQQAVLRPLELAGLVGSLPIAPVLPVELAERLRAALTGRVMADHAQGIVMADRRLDAAEAFAALIEQAQQENLTVGELADRIVTTVPRQSRGVTAGGTCNGVAWSESESQT
ncbi:MAG TPA: anti-sigma factor antagonist [Cryptosporangiaceae bacterium]|nr:anti-sigma factor antagonist [Cryptosporangiaceae bacterium]